MVDKALIFLNQQVNSYLQTQLVSTSDQIRLSNVVGQNGEPSKKVNSLLMTLVKIEEESAMRPNREVVKVSQNEVQAPLPGLFLNLYVLISANHNDYESALKFLSLVLQFFQSSHTFRNETNPSLQAIGIDSLEIKIHKSSFEAQNQLWGTLGAKYMPSVVYKLRMVQVQNEQPGRKIPVVESLNTNLSNIS